MIAYHIVHACKATRDCLHPRISQHQPAEMDPGHAPVNHEYRLPISLKDWHLECARRLHNDLSTTIPSFDDAHELVK